MTETVTTPFVMGRRVEHDDRSRGFRAPEPTSIRTKMHQHYGPPLDQGQVGSCTGNATVDMLMTKPLFKPRRHLTEMDALKIYSTATVLDEYPGTYPPTDTGSSSLAACKAAQQAGLITAYNWCFGVDHVIAALQVGPVMVGTTWRQDMFTPDAGGQIHATGQVVGGHEYVLTGIDVRKKRFRILNSWGLWGLKGMAWISVADMDSLLNDSGDAVQLVA